MSTNIIITMLEPKGNYSGTITAPGYYPVQVTFIFDKGVEHLEVVIPTAIAEKVTAG